jgi:alkanesulfonate monooxygenase SsuD/methylene tetrahydromethanopterin reductase-like flavin-dependent oxidoreductase (luciferase family)
MRFGVSLPPFGDFADVRLLTETARRAEEAGWDGFFLWDHVFFDPSFHPMTDVWVALGAIAMSTSTIRLGPMVTPLARRRPWILARQTVAVDRASGGRLVLGVGLGDPSQWDFGFFDEPTDPRVRAQRLDEGLEVLTGLWSGEPFAFDGRHLRVTEVRFRPTPVQSPRIPIWVGGQWPNRPPLRRAARFDGFFPIRTDGGLSLEHWRDIMALLRELRPSNEPFDAIHAGQVPDGRWDRADDVIGPFADLGVTWWIEDVSPWRFGHSWEIQWSPEFTEAMDELIRRGPPRYRAG